MSTISVQQLNELLTTQPTTPLADVREAFEYRSIHVEQARNAPLSSLKPDTVKSMFGGAGTSADRPLYVICRSGARSAQACERLRGGGLPYVINVEGGTLGWEKAGLPVARGKAALSVDRQVRIIIGTSVILGILLAHYVHPAFIWLSVFFGAGLIYAGVSDSCALAFLVARAPWNKNAAASGAIACAPDGGRPSLTSQ
jgi:rhodanese-related sulfurtransferase